MVKKYNDDENDPYPSASIVNCSLEVQTFGNHRGPLYGENILEFLKKTYFLCD